MNTKTELAETERESRDWAKQLDTLEGRIAKFFNNDLRVYYDEQGLPAVRWREGAVPWAK